MLNFSRFKAADKKGNKKLTGGIKKCGTCTVFPIEVLVYLLNGNRQVHTLY
jgi:hypothetical protein